MVLSRVNRVSRAAGVAVDCELSRLERGDVGGGGGAAELRFDLARLVLSRRLRRARELDYRRRDPSMTSNELKDKVEASAIVCAAVEGEEEVGVADFSLGGSRLVVIAIDEEADVGVRFSEELADEGGVLRAAVLADGAVEKGLEGIRDWRKRLASSTPACERKVEPYSERQQHFPQRPPCRDSTGPE